MIEKLHDDASGSAEGYIPRAFRRKAAGWLGRAARLAAEFVYPAACPACRAEISAPGGVCAACWRETVFIAPPACFSCGAPIPVGLGPDAVCDSCAHAPPVWSRGVAAVVYGGAGRKLVLGFKHGDRQEVAALAAGWMLRAQAGAGADLARAADLIAPAPLHWRRMVKRRFNQSGELAREIARGAGRRRALALDLLERTRATPSQEGRSRGERLVNVEGAFAVSARWRRRVVGRRVLLIDDVLTTGATLAGCAEACCAAGAADVNVLVFARVAYGDR